MKRKNRHVISYYWRGDVEDQKNWAFPSQEEAWAFVLGEIRKRDRLLSKDVDGQELKESDIDFEKVKKDLFDRRFSGCGTARVVYHQSEAWWDNWFYRISE